VDPLQFAQFEGTAFQPGEFRVAMVLLASLTGFPRETAQLISLVMKSPAESSDDFFVSAESELIRMGFDSPNTKQLAKRINAIIGDWQPPVPMELFVRWAPRVARFSFEAAKTISSP